MLERVAGTLGHDIQNSHKAKDLHEAKYFHKALIYYLKTGSR